METSPFLEKFKLYFGGLFSRDDGVDGDENGRPSRSAHTTPIKQTQSQPPPIKMNTSPYPIIDAPFERPDSPNSCDSDVIFVASKTISSLDSIKPIKSNSLIQTRSLSIDLDARAESTLVSSRSNLKKKRKLIGGHRLSSVAKKVLFLFDLLLLAQCCHEECAR